MKRGNDNAQMRRVSIAYEFFDTKLVALRFSPFPYSYQEEVEALNDDEENSGDEGEERGTFKRASADVLAGRKIVKIRRLICK